MAWHPFPEATAYLFDKLSLNAGAGLQCHMLHVDLVSNVTADSLGDDAIDAHNMSVILVDHSVNAIY
jgi:hypothetical protein